MAFTARANRAFLGRASFFGPLPLLPPGIVDARVWRPGGADAPAPAPRDGWMIVGVARVG